MTEQDRADIKTALSALQEIFDGVGYDTTSALSARVLLLDDKEGMPDVHRIDELISVIAPTQ